MKNRRFSTTLFSFLFFASAGVYSDNVANETPSLELLEFLGNFIDQNGDIVDPWTVVESGNNDSGETEREERQHD